MPLLMSSCSGWKGLLRVVRAGFKEALGQWPFEKTPGLNIRTIWTIVTGPVDELQTGTMLPSDWQSKLLKVRVSVEEVLVVFGRSGRGCGYRGRGYRHRRNIQLGCHKRTG